MNDDADLYSQHNEAQKRDVSNFLDKHLILFNWKDGDRILDVGAAEGTTTFEILLPKLPKSFNELVLCDLSEDFLNVAKRKTQDGRVKFLQMDISTEKIPEDLLQRFDHIFSFVCLQWIGEEIKHQQAIKNMFDMLKPGGDVFCTILAKTPSYDIYENMAKSEKWAPFVRNVERFVSPYHHSKNPKQKLRQFLENVGFQVNMYEFEKRFYTYPSWPNFKEFALSINAFVKDVPEEDRHNYIADLEIEKRKHDMVRIEMDDDGNEKVHRWYEILVVHASRL